MSLSATTVRRAAVVLQLAAALGIAKAWVAFADWSWTAALAAGIGIVLALFGLSIALAFAVSLGGGGLSVGPDPAIDSPERPGTVERPPRLTPGQWLRCYLRECVAVFRMFNWLQPFRARRAFAPAQPVAGRSLPPLLLVHGYGCNRAVWLDLQPRLAAAGYPCDGIDLHPMLADIDDYSAALLDALHALAQAHGRAPVMVCHSMGGLAARAALARARRAGRPAPCAGVVTIGTPHHGCTMALLGSGTNARQMQPGSAWLRALAASEGPDARRRLVSIFSWHDSIAGPPQSGWLAGARHIAMAGMGHVSLLREHEAGEAVLQGLAWLVEGREGE